MGSSNLPPWQAPDLPHLNPSTDNERACQKKRDFFQWNPKESIVLFFLCCAVSKWCFVNTFYLDQEVELAWVICCSNDLLCSQTPGKPFRPVQYALISNRIDKLNTFFNSQNNFKGKRTLPTVDYQKPPGGPASLNTWCRVSWQTLTWALQNQRLPSSCCLPPPCRHPRASSRTPRSAPAQKMQCLQMVVKSMLMNTTHMALKVANWLPGVVIRVLPSLPLHKVLRLSWEKPSWYSCSHPKCQLTLSETLADDCLNLVLFSLRHGWNSFFFWNKSKCVNAALWTQQPRPKQHCCCSGGKLVWRQRAVFGAKSPRCRSRNGVKFHGRPRRRHTLSAPKLFVLPPAYVNYDQTKLAVGYLFLHISISSALFFPTKLHSISIAFFSQLYSSVHCTTMGIIFLKHIFRRTQCLETHFAPWAPALCWTATWAIFHKQV